MLHLRSRPKCSPQVTAALVLVLVASLHVCSSGEDLADGIPSSSTLHQPATRSHPTHLAEQHFKSLQPPEAGHGKRTDGREADLRWKNAELSLGDGTELPWGQDLVSKQVADLSTRRRSLLQAPAGAFAPAPTQQVLSALGPQPDQGVLSIEAVIDLWGANLLPFGQGMQQAFLDVLNLTVTDAQDDSFQLLAVEELLPLTGPSAVSVNNTPGEARVPAAGRRLLLDDMDDDADFVVESASGEGNPVARRAGRRLLQALAAAGDSSGLSTLPHVEVRVRILVLPSSVELIRRELVATLNGPILPLLANRGLNVQYIQLSFLNLNYGNGSTAPLQASPARRHLSRVAIGLIAAGGIVFIVVVALAGLLFLRRRKQRLLRQSSDLEKDNLRGANVRADAVGHPYMNGGASENGLGALVGGLPGSHSNSLVGSSSSHRSSAGQVEDTDVAKLDADPAFDTRAWNVPFTELHFSRVIGEGSFGKVFLGKWRETAVAIKLLSQPGGPLPDDSWDLLDLTRLKDASWSDSHQARSKAQRLLQEELHKEAGLMSSLRHPNIVMFLGVSLEPPCMVTEFCARGSLLDVLHRARNNPSVAAELDWRKRLKLALDAAKGMFYLHSRQPSVLHRDLKSANLLVDKHWQVKVADFNLSRVMQPSAEVSSLAATNPRWLPPEVLAGKGYNCAADVYSFGIILWELLTWRVPWEDFTPWQVVISVVDHQHRPEIPVAAELPGGLPEAQDVYLKLMQQCWASEPDTRPTYEAIIGQVRLMIDEEDEASRRRLQSPAATEES